MLCFLLVTVGWVFSVCLHEFGHAFVAYQGGDTSVEEKGYLSMNPIHYAHPVMSFLMPIIFMMAGGLGLPGGAVYINHNLLRSKAIETWVSLAGPAMNLGLSIIITLLLRFFFIPYHIENVGTYALAFLLQLQISAIVFNLIPVPPLDGFQALEPWIPGEWKEHLQPLREYGMYGLFILLWFVPPFYQAFWNVVYFFMKLLGVDPIFGRVGYFEYQFWRHLN